MIGSVGCGNMGSVVLEALYSDNKSLPQAIIYTPSKASAQITAKRIKALVAEKIEDLLKCEYIILAMKPQQLSEVSEKLKGYQGKIVSMLAGVTTEKLEALFQGEVLRIMPNIPMKVGAGTLLYTGHSQSFQCFIDALESGTRVIKCIDDNELDLKTLLFGCGPAIFMEIVSVFERAFVNYSGLSLSREELVHLIEGSIKLLSDQDADKQINQVTSKGGVTIEILEHFRSFMNIQNLTDSFSQGHKRTKELAVGK